MERFKQSFQEHLQEAEHYLMWGFSFCQSFICVYIRIYETEMSSSWGKWLFLVQLLEYDTLISASCYFSSGFKSCTCKIIPNLDGTVSLESIVSQ